LLTKILHYWFRCMLRLTHKSLHSFYVGCCSDEWSIMWSSFWTWSSRFYWCQIYLCTVGRLVHLGSSETFLLIFRWLTNWPFALWTTSVENVWYSSCYFR
jgi:hypothetical protein